MMVSMAPVSAAPKSLNPTGDQIALKPPVQPAPGVQTPGVQTPGVQTAPDAPDAPPLLPPGGASAPLDPRLISSVHSWLFGGPAARTWDNVTGGAYNFSENDALLRFRFENASLLDALGAEFNDDQLMRIAGKVAEVLQENVADGLHGLVGFHLFPADTQNALLANIRAAIRNEVAQIRDEATPETPAQQPRPGPSEQHWPDWTRFVVPADDGPSPTPATPTFRDPIPPVTFNEMPTTQTRRAPAPLDPETLAAMQDNAQHALELEALQSKLQDEIDGILGQQRYVIAAGRGRHELQELEGEFRSGFIPGPISDPDLLGALAQRVLERAKELAADGYPHYADALIRAFREKYPEFGGETDEEGGSGAPGRVERELERGSEFTTGESYGDSVAEEARRLREGGDPAGALALISEYLRSHGAPMEGATGGAHIASSASTAIMNELRNMLPWDLAQMVLEMGYEINNIRPEYHELILQLLLSLGSEAKLMRQAVNILRGLDINTPPGVRYVSPNPPSSDVDQREAGLHPLERQALMSIRQLVRETQAHDPSPMELPLSHQEWYHVFVIQAMRGIGDTTPQGLITIVSLIEEEFGLDEVDLNVLNQIYTALMLVPEGLRGEGYNDALRRVEDAMRNQGQDPYPVIRG